MYDPNAPGNCHCDAGRWRDCYCQGATPAGFEAKFRADAAVLAGIDKAVAAGTMTVFDPNQEDPMPEPAEPAVSMTVETDKAASAYYVATMADEGVTVLNGPGFVAFKGPFAAVVQAAAEFVNQD